MSKRARIWGSICAMTLICLSTSLILFGSNKLCSFDEFVHLITSQQVVSPANASIAALTVACVESIVGIASLWLVLRGKHQLSAMLLGLLFAGMSFYVLLLYMSPPKTPTGCGCGMTMHAVHDWASIVMRNCLLTLGTIIVGISSARVATRL